MRELGVALANAVGGIRGVPWLSLLMLSGGLVLLALVVWQWTRSSARRAVSSAAGPMATAEVQSLVRELIAELDLRADRLERLIAEADRRLERAEDREPVAPRPPAQTSSRTHAARAEPDPMARRVYGLADEGLPIVEIARRLEQPTGKVELILALRGR